MTYETCKDGLVRPLHDTKLRQVDDWVLDMQVALPHVKKWDVAVQAGGAYGVWPLELCKRFARVYTFEPEPLNFVCLSWNTRFCHNLRRYQAALGAQEGWADYHLDASEWNNAGAGYMLSDSDGSIPVMTIDSLDLQACDLLCLDVEGFETFVLQGARQTIVNYSPVIMIEAKSLPQMEGYGVNEKTAIDWLVERRGYKVVEKVHRDLVLVRDPKSKVISL